MRANRLLEAIDELLVNRLAIRLRLRQIHLADIFWLLRIGNRDAVLIGDVDAARLHVLDLADDVIDVLELDRAVDDADEVVTAIEHRIGDDRDELAARARNRWPRHVRLLRLADLLDVLARRAIHVDALVAHGLAVHGRVREHGKAVARRLLVMRKFCDNLLLRGADQSAVARKSFDLHRMTLELLFDVVGRRLTDLR